jgi:hypothetical protein
MTANVDRLQISTNSEVSNLTLSLNPPLAPRKGEETQTIGARSSEEID